MHGSSLKICPVQILLFVLVVNLPSRFFKRILCFILFKIFRTIVRQFSFVGTFFGNFLPSVDAHGNIYHAIIILAISQCLHKRNLVCYCEEFFFTPKSQIKVVTWWHFWYNSV